MPKICLLNNSTRNRVDRGVHIFRKCINLKVKVIAQLEFELAYYNDSLQTLATTPTRLSLEIGIFFF